MSPEQVASRPSWVPTSERCGTFPPLLHLLYARTYTHQERGLTLLDVMQRRILSGNPSRLNILEVGIGKTSCVVSCPFEPYWIAALLEDHGIDYSMVLIDKEKKILEDVERRRRIYAAFSVYAEETLQMRSWRRYVELTGQDRSIVHRREDGLEFTGLGWAYLRKPYLPRLELKNGILTAGIPGGFGERIANGKVSFEQGNIIAMDLNRLGRFDFIVCMNTLCYLSRKQQALVMFKMAGSLNRGGRLLVGDVEEWLWGLQPLAAEFGGWLNQQKAAELGLMLEETSSRNAINPFVLFRKD